MLYYFIDNSNYYFIIFKKKVKIIERNYSKSSEPVTSNIRTTSHFKPKINFETDIIPSKIQEIIKKLIEKIEEFLKIFIKKKKSKKKCPNF